MTRRRAPAPPSAKAATFDLTPKEAVALQRELATQVDIRTPLGRVRRVAGVDVSFNIGGDVVYAVVVVIDRATGEVLERAEAVQAPRLPYIPGLLSFRELPPLLAAFARLRTEPDVIIADGVGYAHPRRIGIASHLGLCLGRPTIGNAKSVLCGTWGDLGEERGSRAPLVHKDEVVGYALRTRAGVSPVFVSPGHLCTFDDACALVLELAPKYRLPTPIRLAHEYANEVRRRAGASAALALEHAPRRGKARPNLAPPARPRPKDRDLRQ